MTSAPPLAPGAQAPTGAELGEHHRALRDNFSAEWMGTHVVRAERGEAVIQMRVRREMLNGFGMAQGGLVFAFADTAFAIACNHAEEGDTITVAQGVDVNFLRPAYEGQTLTAHARVVHDARSGVYDIDVYAQGDDDEEPVHITMIRGRSRTVPSGR